MSGLNRPENGGGIGRRTFSVFGNVLRAATSSSDRLLVIETKKGTYWVRVLEPLKRFWRAALQHGPNEVASPALAEAADAWRRESVDRSGEA